MKYLADATPLKNACSKPHIKKAHSKNAFSKTHIQNRTFKTARSKPHVQKTRVST
jgi:hypothetical protein